MSQRMRSCCLSATPSPLIAVAAAWAVAAAPPSKPSLPLIYVNTTEGARLLKTASHDVPFWQIAPRLQTELPGQCGPTTAAVLLNALASQGLQAPVSDEYSPHVTGFNLSVRYWDQHNVLKGSECVESAAAHWNGSLEQVGALISCRGPQVRSVRASRSSPAEFRAALRAAFSAEPLRHVAVNFDRRALGQAGFGHHSPVGAYDSETDRVLVMDVARYRYPPAWVGLEDLFAGMNDTAPVHFPGYPPFYGTPRGFLVVGMQSDVVGRQVAAATAAVQPPAAGATANGFLSV